jgi:hypothetical protein
MKTFALLALLSLSGSGLIERQMEHPWGRWQPGAWIETKTTSSSSPSTFLERNQLVRFQGDGYDLQSEIAVEGGESARNETHKTWAFGGFAHLVPGARKVGTDTIDVGGKTYECETWECSWQEKNETLTCRSWTHGAFALPLRTMTTSSNSGFTLTLVDPNDSVTVKDRKILAARYEGSGRTSETSVQLLQWMSLEVPGGIVRMESTVQERGQVLKIVREVTSFRGVPLSPR